MNKNNFYNLTSLWVLSTFIFWSSAVVAAEAAQELGGQCRPGLSKTYQSIYGKNTVVLEIQAELRTNPTQGKNTANIKEPETLYYDKFHVYLTNRFHSTRSASPKTIQAEDGSKWLILDFSMEGIPLLLEPERCLRQVGFRASGIGYTCYWIEKYINGKIINGINVTQGGDGKTKHGYFMSEDGNILLFWFVPQDKKEATLPEVYVATNKGINIQDFRNCIPQN